MSSSYEFVLIKKKRKNLRYLYNILIPWDQQASMRGAKMAARMSPNLNYADAGRAEDQAVEGEEGKGQAEVMGLIMGELNIMETAVVRS